MINPEKGSAVNKFTKSNDIEVQAGLVESLENNPEFIADEGFRVRGIKSALTIYKIGLYRLGVAPSIILEGTRSLSDKLNRSADPIQQGFSMVTKLRQSILNRDAEAVMQPVTQPSRVLPEGVVEAIGHWHR
jgi:hypothetical protein